MKTAVVSGASKGIGAAVASALVENGYKVWGLCRTKPADKKICFLSCDVTDAKRVGECFKTVFDTDGKIDILINNAGMGISGAVEFASDKDIKHQMEVNFMGAVNCVRSAVPYMRESGGGKILFTSSLAAVFPLPFQAYYSASKAAVSIFSDALRLETSPFKIKTCSLLLGDIKTAFTSNRIKNDRGDAVYSGRISKSVAVMERDEQNGMSPDSVAKIVVSLLGKKHLPSKKVVGFNYKFFYLLSKILPSSLTLRIVGLIYA